MERGGQQAHKGVQKTDTRVDDCGVGQGSRSFCIHSKSFRQNGRQITESWKTKADKGRASQTKKDKNWYALGWVAEAESKTAASMTMNSF